MVTAVAAVIALGATATGLALTGTWPFDGSVGSTSNASAKTAAKETPPAFADGVAQSWSVPGDAFGGDTQVPGYLPRMMPLVSEMSRSTRPIQLQSGLLVSYGAGSSHGDMWSVALLSYKDGSTIWSEENIGYPVSCDTNEAKTEAACVMAIKNDEVNVNRFGAEGTVDKFESLGGSVHYSEGGLLLLYSGGAIHYELDGTKRTEVKRDTTMAVDSGHVVEIECLQFYAAGTASFAGESCGDRTSLFDEAAFTWALVDEQKPKWVFTTSGRTDVVDAKSQRTLWSAAAEVPGWYDAPLLIDTDSGKGTGTGTGTGTGMVLVRDGVFSIFNLETGAEQVTEATLDTDNFRTNAAVVGDEFVTLAANGDEATDMNAVRVFDPNTGLQLANYDIRTISQAREVTGGPGGLLIAHAACDDCSTAEGSHTIDRYTFVPPSKGLTVVPAALQIPQTIPVSCPANTKLLAWAELSDGWIVVCGVSANGPSYVAFQPSNGGALTYSTGSSKPTGEAALGAVEWNADSSRFIAVLEDGNVLSFDHKLGVVTVRGTENEVVDQQRSVRYVFVNLDDGIRTAADTANETGPFDVQAPEDTAEDQIRYMIEVLDKAYQGRAIVKDALPKLQYCKASAGGYGDTVTAMEAVRDNRSELLEALDSMPVDKIPEGQQLLADLTTAIEQSYAANVEYVAWAESANKHGCATLSSGGRAAAEASDPPKERFAKRWNRAVAPKFGVRTFDAWYI